MQSFDGKVIPFKELPTEAKLKMCLCYGYPYPTTPPKYNFSGFMVLCKLCNKPPDYRIMLCQVCEIVFEKDFKHPRYCWDEPMCWECCEAVVNTSMCGHYPNDQAAHSYLSTVEPKRRPKEVVEYDGSFGSVPKFSF
jgi:hypothetical protein